MTEKKEIREQIVLIVEDNLSNYEIAKTFLNDMNICCESATDGIEALDMYETRGKGYYSAILMDINLPRLNAVSYTHLPVNSRSSPDMQLSRP